MDPAPLTADALARARRWFQTEARPYPWTQTDDPYALWISEVMLQQTVVTAAVGPYAAWLRRWPDLASLASAGDDEVLRAWEGLGYPSRARNLLSAARILVSQGKRTLPDTEPELRALPGIGEYTAAALLSFAFHQPALTLDANLKRVFQRLSAAPVWTAEVEAVWRERWSSLVEGSTSRESNQAIMQMGQRVCRTKAPLCSSCPLADCCLARERNLVDQIPAAQRRQIIEKNTTVVFWHRDRSRWWLARPLAGRFSNLWLVAPAVPPVPSEAQRLSGRVHTYTKYRDRLTAYSAEWMGIHDPPGPAGWVGRWVTREESRNLGMVSAYRTLLEEAQFSTLL